MIAEYKAYISTEFDNLWEAWGGYLNSCFNDLSGWLTGIKNSIWEGINNIGQWFTNLITNLGEWFKSVGEWFSNLITNLGEWFKSVGQWFAELPSKVGEVFKELFMYLFVPEDNPFSTFKDFITEKFPVVDQAKELVDVALGSIASEPATMSSDSYGSEPVFKFTWQGVEVPLIDLTPFTPYKRIVDGIIVAICYFLYIMRLFKRVPSLIRGL